MEEVFVEELQAALQTYQESLAELEQLGSGSTTDETNEVRLQHAVFCNAGVCQSFNM